MNPTKTKIILISIILFSFLLRFWQLDRNPAGFFCDEASTGVDAQNILRTGKDRHGEKLPLFFQGFNYDNVSPYQVYLTIPFIALFGLTEKAVRLAPVFWGTLEILFFYLLLSQFIPKNFAILGTLFLTISPWHFHLTRINMGDFYSWTFLTLLGSLFLVKAIKETQTKYYLLSALFFGLATYSYTPSRLITPILVGLIILTLLIKKFVKKAVFFTILYLFVIIPFLVFHFTNPHSFQRLKDTVGIDTYSNKSTVQPAKIFEHFLSNYLLHYSDNFLFYKGDVDYPGQFIRRHSIAGMGLFYPYQKIFILAGIIWTLFQLFYKKRPEYLIVAFLFILFPVSSSLTKDAVPFATRGYLGVLPFNLLNGFGLYAIYLIIQKYFPEKRKIVKTLFSIVLFLLFSVSIITLIKHFNDNPQTTSDYWGWQFGPREVFKYFNAHENEYDDLIMTGTFNGAYIFLDFYAPNCHKCRLGNLDYLDINKHQLFALRPEEIEINREKIIIKKEILYPNGKVALIIFKIQ